MVLIPIVSGLQGAFLKLLTTKYCMEKLFIAFRKHTFIVMKIHIFNDEQSMYIHEVYFLISTNLRNTFITVFK